MSVLKIASFLDTNLFLHFRPLNEIDWCRFLQADAVEIKIAPVVTRELEEQKTLNPSRKLRERAATALRLLHSYLGESRVRQGVTLEFLINEPTAEWAATRGFNLQIADDRLIGTLLLYHIEYPDVPCTLVTSDLPLRVKATHHQIKLVTPGDDLRLPSEPDALEIKNKQLEAELLRLKSRQPTLKVLFEDGQDFSRFQIARPGDEASDSAITMRSELEAAKAKCPLVELREPQQQSEVTAIVNNPLAQMAESIRAATTGAQTFFRQHYEDYNDRARAYYRDYEKYLRDSSAFKTLEMRTIKLNLILANTGTCPAEDIRVFLHFPDGFELYDEEHPPKGPKEPTVPSKELDLFPNLSSLSSFDYVPRLPQFRDRSLPRIRKTNSYEVELENPKLQHGLIWPFAAFYVAFDSWESANSFSIDYTIYAGNLIDEETGEVGVVINRV